MLIYTLLYAHKHFAVAICKINDFLLFAKIIPYFCTLFLLNVMNFLDLLIAVPLGYLIYKGYKRGLIFTVSDLAGVVVGCILAVRLSNWFASLVGLKGEGALIISFFVIFVAVIVLSKLLAKAVEGMVKLVHAGMLNNLAGALLGLLKGLCIVGVLLYLVTLADFHEKVLTRNTKESSVLYQPVVRTGGKLTGKMSQFVASRRDAKESDSPSSRQ